jgi:molybdopterin converting factor small subunit
LTIRGPRLDNAPDIVGAVKIEVRLFANLARYLPPGSRGDTAILDVPEAATVDALVRGLAIPADLPGLLLVNGREAPADRRLHPGDVVSIVPPLAGG